MYFYLYDSFLQEKKYAKTLAEIEARLIDLSIQGRTARLTILNDMKEMIYDAVRAGTNTVVVLGDDKTVSKALHAVTDLDVTLGIIPIDNSQTLAKYLGIPAGLAACEILSKRIKEKIDVARINGNHFAFYLKALSNKLKIVSPDQKYSLTPLSQESEIFICNFKPKEINLQSEKTKKFFAPQDGKLELVIYNPDRKSIFNKFFQKNSLQTKEGYTILPFQEICLENAKPDYSVRLKLDNDKIIKAPAKIQVIPKRVTVIVGRERRF